MLRLACRLVNLFYVPKKYDYVYRTLDLTDIVLDSLNKVQVNLLIAVFHTTEWKTLHESTFLLHYFTVLRTEHEINTWRDHKRKKNHCKFFMIIRMMIKIHNAVKEENICRLISCCIIPRFSFLGLQKILRLNVVEVNFFIVTIPRNVCKQKCLTKTTRHDEVLKLEHAWSRLVTSFKS